MEEKNFECYSPRLAAWLMLHNIRLKQKQVFIFEADERIANLIKDYNKIINQENKTGE